MAYVFPIFLAVVFRSIISANWHHYAALRKRRKMVCMITEVTFFVFIVTPVIFILLAAIIDGAFPAYSIAAAEWMQQRRL